MPNHCLNQCSLLVSWTLENNLQWNFNQNIIFVCRSQCVKPALCAQYQFTVSNIPNLWAELATSLQTSLGCKLKRIPSHTANKLVWSIRLQDPKGLNSTRNMCMCPLIAKSFVSKIQPKDMELNLTLPVNTVYKLNSTSIGGNNRKKMLYRIKSEARVRFQINPKAHFRYFRADDTL